MIPARIAQIDFATLRTLQLVYRLKSFSAAAQELNINQSGVSYTIDKLRKALDDPLFVRQGGGIAPTTRCVQAVDAASHILSEAERMATAESFDPGAATGIVKISSGYLARTALIGPFLQRLRLEAPGLRLHLSSQTNVERALFDENVDLAISPAQVEINGVYKEVVYRDRERVLMSADNPLAKVELTMERFLEAEHITFDLGIGFRQFWIQRLNAQGINPKIAITTFDGMDFPPLIRGTNLLATIAFTAPLPEVYNLVTRPHPVNPAIEVNMHWTAAQHRSPQNAWLRKVMLEAGEAHVREWAL